MNFDSPESLGNAVERKLGIGELAIEASKTVY